MSMRDLVGAAARSLRLTGFSSAAARDSEHLHSQEREGPDFIFEEEWQILGPFQIGTREASWGADPLEKLGGFRALEFDPGAHFFSSLPNKGLVYWSIVRALNRIYHEKLNKTSFEVLFQDVDWDFLQRVYGWAAKQYQAWARGTLVVGSERGESLAFYTDSILECWIDDTHYFGGDVYCFQRAPIVLHLEKGRHRVDLRLIRDVRAMGGTGTPSIQVDLKLERLVQDLSAREERFLVADVVNGKLVSPLASVPLTNNTSGVVYILGAKCGKDDIFVLNSPLSLQPGQTRPLCLQLLHEFLKTIDGTSPILQISVRYRVDRGLERELDLSKSVSVRNLKQPHKCTFLHPSGIVSFAILRPPLQHDTKPNSKLPVLVNLHGAGLEADSPTLRHSLDDAADLDAWIIFPSGVTAWGADDWHSFGWTDVEAAISAIEDWIKVNTWAGPAFDADRLFVIGHSNGGQGAWYAITHQPDRIIAAAVVSGYTSIQSYVPFQMWHECDPFRNAVLSSALNSYRHELLIGNARVPIFQQHGRDDNNVPAYHSRRMRQLLQEVDWGSDYTELEDTKRSQHWFEGIMTTEALKNFYLKHLTKTDDATPEAFDFNFVIANPGDQSSLYGVRVLHLIDPGIFGRINGSITQRSISLSLSNIEIVQFQRKKYRETSIVLDGNSVYNHDTISSVTAEIASEHLIFQKSPEGWARLAPIEELEKRHGRQLGSMNSLLNSHGRFTVQFFSPAIRNLACQISNNFQQYFAADVELISADFPSSAYEGNLISLGIGANMAGGLPHDHPIRPGVDTVSIQKPDGSDVTYRTGQHGLGCIFLRPLPCERLGLFVWGSDCHSLAVAARLIPMLTGVCQPDFVIMTREMLWKGLEGALALGFLDSRWRITRSSFIS